MRCLLLSLLLGCASHVPQIAVPPRIAPPLGDVPTVQACWVEFADSLGFTASGLLLRHRLGTVLVDAGQSRQFSQEIAEVPFSSRLYLHLVPGALVPELTAADVLRQQVGQDARTLAGLIVTHVHSDHVGGVMDLPDVPVILPRTELAHVQRAAPDGPFNVVPAHAQRVVKLARPFDFQPQPYEVFPAQHDLFGDGSIVLVPLAGHTPGSLGVFVNTREVRLFHAGDAINELAALAQRRGKAFPLGRTDLDPQQADVVVAQIASLHAQLPSLRILPAHERSTWLRVFGAPGRCL